ncbi:MAG: hypothetical protein IPO09_22175 [Anaeromyxobacter sp.]|nr:hypothetical protein [Anaeromyxobacter sp.]MBL0274530.1 hypothetical protein [Anaeromyxobacter sp.]
MNALLAALLLAALPFPAPRLAAATDRTKCDAGVVVSTEAVKGEVVVKTAAGLVTFKAGPDVQVFDAAGKPVGAPSALQAGQQVRLWYLVDGAARAVEIALE